MTEGDWLAERFEGHRGHLRAVARRMLGSASDADDAVQEAWLRLSRSDVSEVQNLVGWLTTVTARVCLDMLRSRDSRREQSLEAGFLEPHAARETEAGATGTPVGGPGAHEAGPEQEALLADSVGLALLVVLDALGPAERVAFVLHDMFAVPFDEIGPILERSPDAAKMLASRARRRVQGAAEPGTDLRRQRHVVDAFLAASRGGDFAALLALLDPDVLVRADDAAVRLGSVAEIHGPDAVAGFFAGRARGARRALLGGRPGAVWAPGGRPRVALLFRISGGKITGIDLVADAEHLRKLDPAVLGG